MPYPPRKLTHNGETLTLMEWAAKTGINADTIRSRINHQGYDVSRALTTPVASKNSPKNKTPVPPPRQCPKMLRHKGKNVAYSRWQTAGETRYAYYGPWGSQEAVDAYQRFQIEWAMEGARRARSSKSLVHVCELVEVYLEHVTRYYVKDTEPTSEQQAQRSAMRVLLELHKDLPINDFKPRHLKACQQAMVAKGWMRGTVNSRVRRIIRCFSWGVAEELVPVALADALEHVPNLQAGRTTARDPEPVTSVPEHVILATLPHLDANPERAAILTAMIRFHEVSGCRPGELCAMTADAIDTNETEWAYRVRDKNTHRQWRRKPLTRWFGPRAQEILRPFLANPGPGGRIWCFPPRFPNGPKAKRVPISSERYAEKVRMACKLAGVEFWHPHQLRHNRATAVQRIYESDDAAAVAIGDTPEVTRAIYIDPNHAIARRIARATG
ncbi:catalytic phage domain protein : Putative uncharacterized protein OS=Rhodopirellula baltica (strain SH1) GN=RB11615 PE=4 SV=1: Phage_integrase [Gemmata massiliana]|uniref:Tyr recombinase domain-containing protein n=1 Tax=Gemmata massiliana TaxID=1210884 RepID=A0A6P2D2F5_9BACT|nr:site-specific integrase [Gemmata massiliana]VTR93580.1 catalytic phage domain protein : Putative uncharacterized protein OS=Rhodopirellula baltica (strain SH1) GN=RB11615 PE=4 SV=1: Phage_integrase [Gemmata massiliana]